MAASAHQDPAFTNAVTYTVAITYTVAGGARRGTAHRRAEKVAERLASHAARSAGVVDVSAVAGPSHDGQPLVAQRVRFAAANSGQGSHGEPGKLARYLDPDRERALASRARADAEAQALKNADRDRRSAVRCANLYGAWLGTQRRPCHCVYCEPDAHYRARQAERRSPASPVMHRCLCGQQVAAAGERCPRHRDTRLVPLEGDGSALQLLAGAVEQEPRP